MPMFEENPSHSRLGIIEKPGEFMEGKTVFHILDSFPSNPFPKKEEKQLQSILLQYFKDASFEEGRIVMNVARVPRQNNSKDCACFTIYFGTKFLKDPDATMALIKTRFSTKSDATAAWGLKDNNLTFVRREIRTLLFKYASQGEAVVEYE